jgi:F420H(2)-dependent quinone reductase
MSTTAPSAPIRIGAPSPRALRIINPFVSAILRSPLHGILSRDVLLLTFAGRRSGGQFTIPVGYTREGETLTVFSTRAWWKNLRGGASVVIRLEGRSRTARAEPTDDRETVVAEVRRYLDRYGVRGAGTRIGVVFDPSHVPSRDELARRLPHLAVIHLALDPIPEGPR